MAKALSAAPTTTAPGTSGDDSGSGSFEDDHDEFDEFDESEDHGRFEDGDDDHSRGDDDAYEGSDDDD